jgi:transcription initiation factor TFIIIB Brf1 subunit/transcription initiation factor TFIIB
VEAKKFIPENTPHSIAAGIVYYISLQCNLNIDKRDIHMVSQISEVTINKCCKKLEKFNDRLLPRTVLEKYNV